MLKRLFAVLFVTMLIASACGDNDDADSGGVQEETTALGVACLTLRDATERPITIDQGTNHLVGTDPEVIVAKASSILDDGYQKRCPELWDGHAGERIAEALIERLNNSHRLRPTDHAQR
jgi:UDP-N-acetylglucosamine 2-epimerase (non-hydrolysing)